jgi:hypothetical protein
MTGIVPLEKFKKLIPSLDAKLMEICYSFVEELLVNLENENN